MLRFFGPSLAKSGLVAPKLTAPFARIVDRVVTNPWLRQFLDLECFVLSGMLAKDTICAEVCAPALILHYSRRVICRAAPLRATCPRLKNLTKACVPGHHILFLPLVRALDIAAGLCIERVADSSRIESGI